MPVYNVEDYLPKCLETITRQTYKNLEIILIDDGSTDSSGSICDEFAEKDSRVRVIHQERKRQFAARNLGQKISRGKYLIFVDGDDYLHLETVNILHDGIVKDSGYDIAMVDYKETFSFDEDITSHSVCQVMTLSRDDLIGGYFNGGSLYNPIWNKLFKKSTLKDIWAHDYFRGQDSDYVLRTFFKANNAIWMRVPLYYYVQRKESITHLPENQLIGIRCHALFLYDNLQNLSPENTRYRHYLLKNLYQVMSSYIEKAWETSEREEVCCFCKRYEKNLRLLLWRDRKLGTVEKMSLTLNVRFPAFIRFAKRITKGRLTWNMFFKVQQSSL